jgi:hypothetical protein
MHLVFPHASLADKGLMKAIDVPDPCATEVLAGIFVPQVPHMEEI